MAKRKKLVLFVEGEGDRQAVPVLVKRLLTDLQAWEHLALELPPLMVGNIAEVTRDDYRHWMRWLQATRKRPDLGGVLVLLDGDLERVRKERFCAADFGSCLAQRAKTAGAGTLFSVGIVFACQEYESWVLAGAERLAGLPFPDGRPGIRAEATVPEGNLEEAPRDAKKWLDQWIDAGYKPARDQEPLTRLLVDHLDTIRQRGMRSFRRLENALQQLVNAIRTNQHIVTPEQFLSSPR
jgi:hypothetical protein